MSTIQITTTDFKEKIFNYETEQEWNYKGEFPAIIDFMLTGVVPAVQWHLCWKNWLRNTTEDY